MNKSVLIVLAGLLLIIAMDSCRWQRRAARRKANREVVLKDTIAINSPIDTLRTSPADTVAAVGPAKQKQIDGLLPLMAREFAWTTFSAKAKMHYEGKGQNQDFTAFFRIEKDKRIWVNVTAAGGLVSVARALITPDSIKARVDLNNTAYALPFSEASKLLPIAVDFATLQNLFVGNAFRPADGSAKAIDAGVLGEDLSLTFLSADYRQQVVYNKGDSLLKLQIMQPQMPELPALRLRYARYESIQNRRFSNERTINVDNKGQAILLEMDFTKVEFEKTLDFSFSIPAKYEMK